MKRTCPHCNEQIVFEAKRCPHCTTHLEPLAQPKPGWWIFSICLLGVAAGYAAENHVLSGISWLGCYVGALLATGNSKGAVFLAVSIPFVVLIIVEALMSLF